MGAKKRAVGGSASSASASQSHGNSSDDKPLFRQGGSSGSESDAKLALGKLQAAQGVARGAENADDDEDEDDGAGDVDSTSRRSRGSESSSGGRAKDDGEQYGEDDQDGEDSRGSGDRRPAAGAIRRSGGAAGVGAEQAGGVLTGQAAASMPGGSRGRERKDRGPGPRRDNGGGDRRRVQVRVAEEHVARLRTTVRMLRDALVEALVAGGRADLLAAVESAARWPGRDSRLGTSVGADGASLPAERALSQAHTDGVSTAPTEGAARSGGSAGGSSSSRGGGLPSGQAGRPSKRARLGGDAGDAPAPATDESVSPGEEQGGAAGPAHGAAAAGLRDRERGSGSGSSGIRDADGTRSGVDSSLGDGSQHRQRQDITGPQRAGAAARGTGGSAASSASSSSSSAAAATDAAARPAGPGSAEAVRAPSAGGDVSCSPLHRGAPTSASADGEPPGQNFDRGSTSPPASSAGRSGGGTSGGPASGIRVPFAPNVGRDTVLRRALAMAESVLEVGRASVGTDSSSSASPPGSSPSPGADGRPKKNKSGRGSDGDSGNSSIRPMSTASETSGGKAPQRRKRRRGGSAGPGDAPAMPVRRAAPLRAPRQMSNPSMGSMGGGPPHHGSLLSGGSSDASGVAGDLARMQQRAQDGSRMLGDGQRSAIGSADGMPWDDMGALVASRAASLSAMGQNATPGSGMAAPDAGMPRPTPQSREQMSRFGVDAGGPLAAGSAAFSLGHREPGPAMERPAPARGAPAPGGPAPMVRPPSGGAPWHPHGMQPPQRYAAYAPHSSQAPPQPPAAPVQARPAAQPHPAAVSVASSAAEGADAAPGVVYDSRDLKEPAHLPPTPAPGKLPGARKGKLDTAERARVEFFLQAVVTGTMVVFKGELAKQLRDFVNADRAQSFYEKLISRRKLNQTLGPLLQQRRQRRSTLDQQIEAGLRAATVGVPVTLGARAAPAPPQAAVLRHHLQAHHAQAHAPQLHQAPVYAPGISGTAMGVVPPSTAAYPHSQPLQRGPYGLVPHPQMMHAAGRPSDPVAAPLPTSGPPRAVPGAASIAFGVPQHFPQGGYQPYQPVMHHPAFDGAPGPLPAAMPSSSSSSGAAQAAPPLSWGGHYRLPHDASSGGPPLGAGYPGPPRHMMHAPGGHGSSTFHSTSSSGEDGRDEALTGGSRHVGPTRATSHRRER